MPAVHRLRFGDTGRSIDHSTATPQASATWEVHDTTLTIDDSNYVVDSGAATVDTTAISLSADAGPSTANARRLTVASTTGIVVGRHYLVSDTAGSEPVEVVGLTTDVSIDLRDPLAGTYTTPSAQIRGLTLTASLADAIAADENRVDFDEPLRIVWTYASGEKHQEQIRVVREDEDDFSLVETLSSVRGLFPGVHVRTEAYGRDTLPTIAAEVRRDMLADGLADGEDVHRRLLGDQGQRLLVWATLRHLAGMGNAPGNRDPVEWLDYCERQYNKRYANVMGTGKAGKHTLRIEPGPEAATDYQDPTDRRRIRFS